MILCQHIIDIATNYFEIFRLGGTIQFLSIPVKRG